MRRLPSRNAPDHWIVSAVRGNEQSCIMQTGSYSSNQMGTVMAGRVSMKAVAAAIPAACITSTVIGMDRARLRPKTPAIMTIETSLKRRAENAGLFQPGLQSRRGFAEGESGENNERRGWYYRQYRSQATEPKRQNAHRQTSPALDRRSGVSQNFYQ